MTTIPVVGKSRLEFPDGLVCLVEVSFASPHFLPSSQKLFPSPDDLLFILLNFGLTRDSTGEDTYLQVQLTNLPLKVSYNAV